MLSFGGRQGIIIDYAMPKILGLSTLGPVKRGSLCHGRTWSPTYAHDLDCKKHMKRNMCIYIYISTSMCSSKRLKESVNLHLAFVLQRQQALS